MKANEQLYLNALQDIIDNGNDRPERTGVGTRSMFGMQYRFDIRFTLPLLTTKKMLFKSIMSELLWFIEGSGDERRLAEIRFGKPRNVIADKKTIWTDNAKADYWVGKSQFNGDLGRVYGQNWRKWLTPNNTNCLIDRRDRPSDNIFEPTDIDRKWHVASKPCKETGDKYSSIYGDVTVIGVLPDNRLVAEFEDGTQVSVTEKTLQSGDTFNPYSVLGPGSGKMGRSRREDHHSSQRLRASIAHGEVCAGEDLCPLHLGRSGEENGCDPS